jgi:hypothetical protein
MAMMDEDRGILWMFFAVGLLPWIGRALWGKGTDTELGASLVLLLWSGYELAASFLRSRNENREQQGNTAGERRAGLTSLRHVHQGTDLGTAAYDERHRILLRTSERARRG